MAWNDKEEEEALRLWNENHSYGFIARHLGKTRGAVSGLASRKHWPRRKQMALNSPLVKIKKPKSEKPTNTSRSNIGGGLRQTQIKRSEQFKTPLKMTRSEMEAMLREAVNNTRAMER